MQKFSPLKVWVIVGLLFTITQITLLIIYQVQIKDKISAKNLIARRELKQAIDLVDYTVQHWDSTKKLSVIVIGSSLVDVGIDCNEYLDKYTKQSMQIHKIAVHGSQVLKVLKENNFFKTLQNLKPDLLLIEADVILYDRKAKNEIFLANLIDNNLIATRYLLNMDYRFNLLNFKPCQDIEKQSKIKNIRNVKSVLTEQRKINSFEKLSFVNQEIQKFQQVGTKVFLLHLPKASIIEQNIHNSKTALEFDNLLNIYNQNLGVKYWKFPNSLSFDYYLDGDHLNYKGRQIYTKWLVEHITKEIPNKP